MTIIEFEKEIVKLNLGYSLFIVKEDNGDTTYVCYKAKIVLAISSKRFLLNLNECPKEFEKFPFSHKLWMLASELAMTPYNERFEHKYNVIVGKDNSKFPYIVWTKDNRMKTYLLFGTDTEGLRKDSDFQFTDSEFKDLIKYIKILPDGEFQANVAEHGKRIVEDK